MLSIQSFLHIHSRLCCFNVILIICLVSYWWRRLLTFWDEFQQHDASMRQYKEMIQASNVSSTSTNVKSTHSRPSVWPENAKPSFEKKNVEWYSGAPSKTAFEKYPNTGNALSPSFPPNITPTPHLSPASDFPPAAKPLFQNSNSAVPVKEKTKLSRAASENSVSPLMQRNDSLRRKILIAAVGLTTTACC